MKNTTSRRDLLKAMAAHGGFWATRSLATGLPISVLLGGIPTDRALAAETKPPQYLLMALNHTGEPINNNCPGVYDTGLTGIHHNPASSMTPKNVTLGGKSYRAAKPWADLQANVPWALDRMSFIHHTTRTNIHAQYAGVMKLMGSSRGPNGENNNPEYLPSIISNALAPIHGAIQSPPLYLAGPGVEYGGQALGKIRPNSLKTLFPSLTSKEKIMRDVRDADLMALNNALKVNGSRKQKAWLEDHVASLDEVRQLNETLVERFSSINNNGATGAIDAALIAFKLNITSVATFNIGFGNDNHNDAGLALEASGTVSGVKTMETMFQRIQAEGMQDQVTFASMGVFGRTLAKKGSGSASKGRDHNLNHHVTIVAGKNVAPGVIGGLQKVGNDFGALPIQSSTGAGTLNGDIPLNESLESTAKTVAAAVGAPATQINKRIQRSDANGDSDVGRIITAALTR